MKIKRILASPRAVIEQAMRKTRVIAGLEAKLAGLEAKLEGLEGLDSKLELLNRHGRIQMENLVNNTFNLAAGETKNGARSVLFLHQSYYHFHYLARALRKRGWNALLLDLSAPDAAWQKYYHGADVHFHSIDPEIHHQFGRMAYEYAKGHFEMIHFAGDGLFSFFRENYGLDIGEDMLAWHQAGKKIGYSISGCNSGVSRESVAQWSMLGGRNVCDTCVWNDRPDVCSPEASIQWGGIVSRYCDLISAEMVPALGAMDGPGVILEPLTMCVDPVLWNPDLTVPPWLEKLRAHSSEVLVYHGMGEAESRSDESRNIKGSPAIKAAVERLQSEGHPVKLVFKTGVPNNLIANFQVQADIIVDQLNYGRYGAQAREGMMLGKPVICYINPHELNPGIRNSALAECPLVSASEETIYEVLKELVMDKAKREKIGRDSHDYAMKWHHPDRCAERYEKVYDALQCGIPASTVQID